MPDARIAALGAITTILLVGITYSLVYDTYLDTSNPFLIGLPHPLHRTHYFASKSNILNVYFIKQAWAWTSGAFLLLWSTSPPTVRTIDRWYKWAVATATWLAFTAWFFGPAIIERVLIASGGECVLSLPSGEVLSVPVQYCHTRTTVSPATHPGLFAATLLQQAGLSMDWHARPRLMRGHDVSGHIFLLTLGVLFLTDQLRLSFRVRPRVWSKLHNLAIAVNVAVITMWLFATWTTSVYFHLPMEKISGYRCV
jgi:hypothetical protein